MEFILNIDAVLISYAYIVTRCHSFVKHQKYRLKCGTWGISEYSNDHVRIMMTDCYYIVSQYNYFILSKNNKKLEWRYFHKITIHYIMVVGNWLVYKYILQCRQLKAIYLLVCHSVKYEKLSFF